MFYWFGQYITMEMPQGIAVKILLLGQTIDFPTNVYFALATKAMNTSAWVTSGRERSVSTVPYLLFHLLLQRLLAILKNSMIALLTKR